jgi:hypothetical protein
MKNHSINCSYTINGMVCTCPVENKPEEKCYDCDAPLSAHEDGLSCSVKRSALKPLTEKKEPSPVSEEKPSVEGWREEFDEEFGERVTERWENNRGEDVEWRFKQDEHYPEVKAYITSLLDRKEQEIYQKVLGVVPEWKDAMPTIPNSEEVNGLTQGQNNARQAVLDLMKRT